MESYYKKKENNLITLIEEVFPDLDQSPSDIISTSQEVNFKCRCSRERSLSALKILGKNELEEIFPDLDQSPSDIINTSQKVNFQCRCSRERSLSALKILGKDELREMITNDGKAELICQFCKNIYIVNEEELISLID